MARLVLILMFVLIGCEEISISSSKCELPCYDGPEGTYNVGQCLPGKPMCVESGFVECTGQVTPSTEMCNGKDDDCDGKTDEAVYDPEIGEPCGTSVGECSTGSWQCYKGELTCYAEVSPKTETCNNKDDDCNGVVDDLGFSDFCYSGNATSLAFPPCHAGILLCQQGMFECLHEVVPSTEVCDGVDNNCNGRIDEGLSTKSYDVVMAVDRSCSMLPSKFEEARQAIIQTALAFPSDSAIRFALIGFPIADDNPVPFVVTDFVDGAEAAVRALNMQGKTGSGLEPSYDVIRSVIDNTLGLSFSPGTVRILVIFTDEAGQTFELPLVHEPQLTYLIASSDIKLIVFVPSSYADSFDDIASASGGGVYPLLGSATMARTITPYIDMGCEE